MENCKDEIYRKIIAVTNRHLSKRPYLEQIDRICQRKPGALLVREKDLPKEEYRILLEQVSGICSSHGVTCIAHTCDRAAQSLGISQIHLSLNRYQENPEIRKMFSRIGVSIHSVEEAAQAQTLGADYLTAGHIFTTGCKPGLAPRGTEFLKAVCKAVDIPVYAIGGMQSSWECLEKMLACGATGICVMSECMQW